MTIADLPMTRTAELSDDGQYRYELVRRWGAEPPAVFVMLNPSTADATQDDPTIRRCINFARAWGCGGLRVVNLYGYRATRPANLFLADDPIGPDADDYLRIAAMRAARLDAPLIAAWGALAPRSRVEHVLALPGMHRAQCLGTTASGAPKHPLYLKADLVPQPWSIPAVARG